MRRQNTLVRCLRLIISPGYFSTHSLFRDQFHRGLKEVYVETKHPIQRSQLLTGCASFIAIIPNYTPHHCPILLLDMTLIVLFVWTRTCKGQLLFAAEAEKFVIDEFGAVVRIKSKQWKG